MYRNVAIHTSINDAYHVVSQSAGEDIEYEDVITPPSFPHSPDQTTADYPIYETV